MKKLTVAVLLACVAAGTSVANATPQNTASVGYAYVGTSVSGINLNGLNLSYRYDFNDRDYGFGLIGSFTWAGKKTSSNEGLSSYDDKINYYSFLVGPVYRLNKFVSFYGQVGLSNVSVTSNSSYDITTGNVHSTGSSSEKGSRTGFSYGAGVQFNPIENLALTVGYEGAAFSNDGLKLNTNGVNVSVGYSF